MRRLLSALATWAVVLPMSAQQVLTLDSCRARALGNNKQLTVAKVQRDIALQMRKSARTKYLPSLNVMGGYILSSREISILSNSQKDLLNNIGTKIGSLLGVTDPVVAGTLNKLGQKVTDGFRTNNRNMFMASAMITQPIYMGGAITAANNIADINEVMAANKEEATHQSTLHSIDNTYWTVVSLRHKQKLADSYLTLVKKLDDDVAKMLLCQLCGMPTESDITLADESSESLDLSSDIAVGDTATAINDSPEMRLLQNAVDLSQQATKLVRAANLPQVLLTGGYMATNPNVYDGYNNKFAGVWNVGVMVRIPVWNWLDGVYKVRASKAATTIARLELDDTREKIGLQVSQSKFKLNEAYKKLSMAQKNVEKAEENMRCANIGFKEGVLQTTDVMEAQTAWMQAQSQKIDAEVDVKISQVNLKKALGLLN